ncbi:MAG: hypothetical protein HRU29_02495 [Rhizobiales bacterium]|nr:hypothetical protein [Hyphomicrobiales bacterium]NRB13248.1 hypothetical protein [Hyphomicrobiales bacterium]
MDVIGRLIIIVIIGVIYYLWKTYKERSPRFVKAAHFLIYKSDPDITTEEANRMANSIDLTMLFRTDVESARHYINIAKVYSGVKYGGRQLKVINAARDMGFVG